MRDPVSFGVDSLTKVCRALWVKKAFTTWLLFRHYYVAETILITMHAHHANLS